MEIGASKAKRATAVGLAEKSARKSAKFVGASDRIAPWVEVSPSFEDGPTLCSFVGFSFASISVVPAS